MLFLYGDTGGRSSKGRCKLSPYKCASNKIWKLVFLLLFKTHERHIDSRGNTSVMTCKWSLEKFINNLSRSVLWASLSPLPFPCLVCHPASFAGLCPLLVSPCVPFQVSAQMSPIRGVFPDHPVQDSKPPSLCTLFSLTLPNDSFHCTRFRLASTWHCIIFICLLSLYTPPSLAWEQGLGLFIPPWYHYTTVPGT